MGAERDATKAAGLNFSRLLYEIWARTSADLYEQMMHTPAFTAVVRSRLEQSLELKRQVDDAAEAVLKSMRFATESDVKAMLEELKVIETTLTRTSSALETFALNIEKTFDLQADALRAIDAKLTRNGVAIAELQARVGQLEQQVEQAIKKPGMA